MEVASFATFARTGSSKRPTNSLFSDSLSSRSALALTSSRVVAYVTAFSTSHMPHSWRDEPKTATARLFRIDQTCLTGGLGVYGELSTPPPCSCALSRPSKLSTFLKGLNTIDRLRNKKKHRGRNENASDVLLTKTEPRHNNQTQNNREMLFSHTSSPFVVETSPVFSPQNLCILSSTTRFHSPLYLPLNNLTPSKVLFPIK